jgi:hypothetical protein
VSLQSYSIYSYGEIMIESQDPNAVYNKPMSEEAKAAFEQEKAEFRRNYRETTDLGTQMRTEAFGRYLKAFYPDLAPADQAEIMKLDEQVQHQVEAEQSAQPAGNAEEVDATLAKKWGQLIKSFESSEYGQALDRMKRAQKGEAQAIAQGADRQRKPQ